MSKADWLVKERAKKVVIETDEDNLRLRKLVHQRIKEIRGKYFNDEEPDKRLKEYKDNRK